MRMRKKHIMNQNKSIFMMVSLFDIKIRECEQID